MVHRIGGLTCLLGAVMTAGAAFAGPPSVAPVQEAVSIYLRPSVALVGPVVTVGDVAALEGGTSAYRRRFAALDLADLSSGAPELDITREQIAFRLRLAGASVNQFRLLGEAHTSDHRAADGAAAPVVASPIKPVAAVEPKPPENPVIIKPRDQVRLLVRVGPLRLTTLCEALQEGRVGQRIRVRNVDSRTERVGRVVDRDTVELDQEGITP